MSIYFHLIYTQYIHTCNLLVFSLTQDSSWRKIVIENKSIVKMSTTESSHYQLVTVEYITKYFWIWFFSKVWIPSKFRNVSEARITLTERDRNRERKRGRDGERGGKKERESEIEH